MLVMAFQMKASTSSSSLASKPPMEQINFERFPKLPAELQIKVWAFAIPGPRVIEINHRSQHKPRKFYYPSSFTIATFHHGRPWADDRELIAFSEPIALLATCHDSRTVALKTYHLLPHFVRSPSYFDPLRDTILLPDMAVMDDVCLHHQKLSTLSQYGIRFLALEPLHIRDLEDPAGRGRFYVASNTRVATVIEAVMRFETLEELIILWKRNDRFSWDWDYGVMFDRWLEFRIQKEDEIGKDVKCRVPDITYLEYEDTLMGNTMREELQLHMDGRSKGGAAKDFT